MKYFTRSLEIYTKTCRHNFEAKIFQLLAENRNVNFIFNQP